ncbi:MAG TPA: hypothetical protein VLT45_20290 [Kofleriaceae bacterium]|nr:hypothetical protein [Kofleriaceae bacterium]
MWKHALMVVALVAACGKSGEEQAKEDNAREQAKIEANKPKDEPAPPPKSMGSAEAPKPVEDKPPEPEPTTPAEIDHARNQAMIDGRDKDVLKYCEMGKLDEKSNPQALLGCTLAACRLTDEATARKYGTPITGPLKDQAKKVCLANQVGL